MRKIKLATFVITAVVGLVTAILAILGLVGVANVNAGEVFGWLLAAILFIDGIIFIVLGLSKAENYMRNILAAALCIGVGIFVSLIPEGDGFVNAIVCGIIPLIAACFGVILVVKMIILLSHGSRTKDQTMKLIVGTILIGLGIVFVVLYCQGNKNIFYFDWLLIGVAMIVYSTMNITNILNK